MLQPQWLCFGYIYIDLIRGEFVISVWGTPLRIDVYRRHRIKYILGMVQKMLWEFPSQTNCAQNKLYRLCINIWTNCSARFMHKLSELVIFSVTIVTWKIMTVIGFPTAMLSGLTIIQTSFLWYRWIKKKKNLYLSLK